MSDRQELHQLDPLNPLNPLDPALAVDPYPTYERLRRLDPVHLTALGAYALTRHADVTQVLRDSVTFQHVYEAQQRARVGPGVEDEPYFDFFRRMVFVLDDPNHRRVRRLMQAAFTPARVAALRPRTAEIAHELIAAHAGTRRMDFVNDVARPLPMRVIGTILGIPDADHERIGADAAALAPVLEFLPMAADVLARANDAVLRLADYFSELIERRRREPADDLLSAMVHATDDGARLTDRELVANAILLYLAGHETSAGGAGLALIALHRWPDQRTMLSARPDLISVAADELLRYDTPGQGTARVLTAPATIANSELPAGSMVLAYLGAANRDPAVFADPDRVDILREQNRRSASATWGGGAHTCIGRALALQELEVLLETLLRECPDWAVSDWQFRPTPLVRGLESLTLTW